MRYILVANPLLFLLEAYIYSTVAYRIAPPAPCSQHFVILFSLLIPTYIFILIFFLRIW